MLDIGVMEILVIGSLALIVVGPKELPGLLRTAGQFAAKVRGMAREFQRSMEDAAREADLDDVAKAIKSGGNLNKMPFDNQIVDTMKEFERSVKSEIGQADSAVRAATAAPAAPKPVAANPTVTPAAAPKPASDPSPAPEPAPAPTTAAPDKSA